MPGETKNFVEENKELLIKVYNTLKLVYPNNNITLAQLMAGAEGYIENGTESNNDQQQPTSENPSTQNETSTQKQSKKKTRKPRQVARKKSSSSTSANVREAIKKVASASKQKKRNGIQMTEPSFVQDLAKTIVESQETYEKSKT